MENETKLSISASSLVIPSEIKIDDVCHVYIMTLDGEIKMYFDSEDIAKKVSTIYINKLMEGIKETNKEGEVYLNKTGDLSANICFKYNDGWIYSGELVVKHKVKIQKVYRGLMNGKKSYSEALKGI